MEKAKAWGKEHLKGNKWNIWIVLLVIGFITGAVDSTCNAIWKPEVVKVWGDNTINVTSRGAAAGIHVRLPQRSGRHASVPVRLV